MENLIGDYINQDYEDDESEVLNIIDTKQHGSSNSLTDLSAKINIYEMCSDGRAFMKSMTIKELFNLINQENPTNTDDINTCDKVNFRELRRLSYNINPNAEATIYVRKHVVILSIDTTRAVITSNRLMFIVPNGADSMLEIIGSHMNGWSTSSTTRDSHEFISSTLVPSFASETNLNIFSQNESFEYHAYDGLLSMTKRLDINVMDTIKKKVSIILKQLRKSSVVSLSTQEGLRSVKSEMAAQLNHFTLIKTVLSDIIEDDETLSFMNLTLLKTNPEIFKDLENNPQIHEKISSLVEVYLTDYNNFSSQIEILTEKIKYAEESVSFRMSVIRNQLMIVNTFLSIVACVIGFCAYVTGIFGMNLDNTKYIQPVPGIFNGVIISTMIFMPTATVIIMYMLKKHKFIP